ncbi:MAG: hypothetical protein RIC80_12590, partial [Cyclobacteriaceae bacterium]
CEDTDPKNRCKAGKIPTFRIPEFVISAHPTNILIEHEHLCYSRHHAEHGGNGGRIIVTRLN